ncbi:MAG: S8 family serine peptidase [Rhizobacter sp.]|nr:S8 family serine peptidase [Ferruginibacter sp.]
MESIQLISLPALMERTDGSAAIKIGLIDGPVSIDHKDLSKENIISIVGRAAGSCSKADSIACNHGTFIAGILKGNRNSAAAAICPGCTLLIRPVFAEHRFNQEAIPATSPSELATAIIDCVNNGAHIINLSLALANPASRPEKDLEKALDYAAATGVLIVAAAGNQGTVGSTAITRHPWVIPVIACNKYGFPLRMSNLGNSIGRNGLSAPGENITSLAPADTYTSFTGTSAATPFVTGVIALLWSLYPSLPGAVIKQAVTGAVNKRRSVIPPVINAQASLEYLNIHYPQKSMYERSYQTK